MDRYSVITTKIPREFVLLQGTGCRWHQCVYCDYHEDVSTNPFEINRPVLEQVTGEFGILDIINSGSAIELDENTLQMIEDVVRQKHIHTLWFEMHYMYRNRLKDFGARFAPATVKFRCGVETFDGQLRAKWHKGISPEVKPEDVAQYFQGICLLCCTKGESKERIIRDIELGQQYFEYFSINLFCNNHTSIQRDEDLAQWFETEIYPTIKDNPQIEVLLNNTDLGVG